MKLNKNGWGFIEFFCFLFIFVVCLIGSFYGLKQLGLMDENHQFIDNNQKNNQNNNKTENKPLVSYAQLEENMVTAAKKYIEEFYNNELGLDTLNIRVSQLKSSADLKELVDNKGNKCSGYVSVYTVDGTPKYDPYLKCKDYETKGYEERKDD